MSAWPGGPCPECGEDMPENLIHCQACRAVLNKDFDLSSVEIPEFIPLREIDAHADLHPTGYYLPCPNCAKELRIDRKYFGKRVQCKHCTEPFRLDDRCLSNGSSMVFSNCPHCDAELRFAQKYIGSKVMCKMCEGQLLIQNLE